MPKLNEEVAEQVENAEGGGVVPEGLYTVNLMEVEVKDGTKFPYWSWVFEIPEGEPHAGSRFWLNTSLSPKALFRMREVFAAFGVPTDTDTDEICGMPVQVMVVQKIIESGKRQGQMGNEITALYPAGEGAKVGNGTGAWADEEPF